MEKQIREVNVVPVPVVPPRPPYDNPQLRQFFDTYKTTTSLSRAGQNLTDQDMEIVADVLKTNTVRSHCFFFNIYILLIP